MVWLLGFAILICVAVLYPWGIGHAYDLANPTEPPPGIHPEWYFMFLFQTLKIVPEWMVIIGFGLVAVIWTLIPWLDKRAGNNKKSSVFTIIGIVAILYMCVMTTWAYISVSQEQKESPASRQEKNSDSTNVK